MKKTNHLLILLLFILILLFIHNYTKKENENFCPTCPVMSDDIEYQDQYSFLNDIQTNNLLCVENTKLGLLRCNNIIEEKYDENENLIYIKTKNNEYFYNYIYDELGRVKIFSFENIVMKISYDEYSRISKINYISENSTKKIVYSYKSLIEDTTGIPEKIEVYNNDKIEYIINYKKEFGDETIITEIKENLCVVYDPVIQPSKRKNFFQLINYIPEPYYINNPFYNNDYLYSNHGLIFDNFKIQISGIKNIQTGTHTIEYFNQEKYSFSTGKDYITILSDIIYDDGYSHINQVAYKDDDKFYKYKIYYKMENQNYYYEITNSEEITKEDYYALFET